MYKENFKEWLELTWYLISEPWVILFNYWFNNLAPKWFVYILLKNQLMHMKEICSQKTMVMGVESILKKNRITQKQADIFISIIKSKLEKRMEVYSPNPDTLFKK
jgi:hypothetical protein